MTVWVVWGESGGHDAHASWAVKGFPARREAERFACEAAGWFHARVPPLPRGEHYGNLESLLREQKEYHEALRPLRGELEGNPFDRRGGFSWSSGEAVVYSVRPLECVGFPRGDDTIEGEAK